MMFLSTLVVKLKRKRYPNISKMVTDSTSLHLEEHHFLTMSIVDLKDINFPTRLIEILEEI